MDSTFRRGGEGDQKPKQNKIKQNIKFLQLKMLQRTWRRDRHSNDHLSYASPIKIIFLKKS